MRLDQLEEGQSYSYQGDIVEFTGTASVGGETLAVVEGSQNGEEPVHPSKLTLLSGGYALPDSADPPFYPGGF